MPFLWAMPFLWMFLIGGFGGLAIRQMRQTIDPQAFDDAERVLRSVLATLSRRLRQRAERNRVDAVADAEPLQKLLAQGYLLLARIYAERGGDLARAEGCADRARRHIARVSPFDRREVEAFHRDTIAWIRYRGGREEEALAAAEQAVRLSGDAEYHYHLAEICFAMARRRLPERAAWLRRAEESGAQATASDLRGLYAGHIAGLRRRIGELAAPAKKQPSDA
jgi:tetratricopeptide (TPR) repeat protein